MAVSLAWTPPASAGAAFTGEVELQQIRYETARGPGGSWFVATIEVVVKPAATNSARFVDRVKVGLELGFECAGGAERRYEFYRTEATAVTLESGRATFRFYLPPEIVERDRLHGDASYHFVELVAAGRVMPTNRKHVAGALPTPEALARFRARVAAEAAANDGILLPQPLTPFATAAGGPPSPTLLIPR